MITEKSGTIEQAGFCQVEKLTFFLTSMISEIDKGQQPRPTRFRPCIMNRQLFTIGNNYLQF